MTLKADNREIPKGCQTLLICEGPGDAAFLGAMGRHMNLGARAIPIGGRSQFRDNIRAVPNDPNFSALRAFGIVRDADDSAARALDRVNGALRDFFGAGANFLKHGEVKRLASGKFAQLSAGAFVLPDGEERGELEDLLLESARESHPDIMECVKDFRACARRNKDAEAGKESKKAVQALISGFPAYCEDLNVALKKRFVNLDSGAFSELRDFLRKLAAA